MITLNEIKLHLIQQNLSGSGFYSIENNNLFNKISTPDGIDAQLSYAISNSFRGGVPIIYLDYNSTQNKIKLMAYRFEQKDGLWTYYSQVKQIVPIDVAWNYSEAEDKYIITGSLNYTLGQFWNNKLPVIQKTIPSTNQFITYVCGGLVPDGMLGFVYGKYTDGIGGYYYTKLSNNPQPPCCSELQLENCGGTYPETGICVQSGCCADNISIC